MWINWNDLPESMKNEQVRHYYKILKKKQGSLIVKRGFDIVASLVMLGSRGSVRKSGNADWMRSRSYLILSRVR